VNDILQSHVLHWHLIDASRSMPYAQIHYPFENKEQFESTFPANFISEGIDQTRGWFYTLLVLSTHLFGRAPWQNLIVTGLVLAA
jgi:isoleucyl-tRNA synthetase